MNLTQSNEPVRTVGHIVTLMVVFIAAGLIAANAGWAHAPEWFRLLSIGMTAGLSAVGIQVGAQAARNAVYPTPKVEAFLTHATAVEPPPPAPTPTPAAPAEAPAPEVDLDAATKAAGLT